MAATVALALSACGAPPRRVSAAGARSGSGAACEVVEVERRALRLGGADVYVEPQAFQRTGTGLLLAGSPVYTWSTDATGEPRFERDRALGVLLEDGGVRAIERPAGLGQVDFLRAARGPSGTWSFLFGEATSPDPREAKPTRITYAELREGRWSELEVVAEHAPEVDYAFHGSSELLATPSGMAWLLPVADLNGRVQVRAYRRTSRGWSYDAIPPRALYTERVEATQLGDDLGGRGWWALTGLDGEADGRVVRLGRLGAGWADAMRVQVAAPGDEIRFPRLSTGGRSLSAGWLTLAPDEPPVAWGAVAGEPGHDPEALLVDPTAEQIVPIAPPDGPTLWLVQHVADPDEPILRVYRHVPPSGAALVGALPHPFAGYFAAVATGGSELVLVGPELLQDPAYPIVRSLLLRLSVSCT